MFGNLAKLFVGTVKTIKKVLNTKAAPVKYTPQPKAPVYKPPTAKKSAWSAPTPKVSSSKKPATFGSWLKRQADIFKANARATAKARKAREAAEAAAAAKRQAEFNKTKAEYEKRARQLVAQHRKGSSTSVWSRLTGGFVGENNSRGFASKQIESIQGRVVGDYDKKLNELLAWQKKYNATLNKKRFTTQKEYNEYLKLAKEEESRVRDLEYTRASITGLMAGYGAEASLRGTSALARGGQWFDKHIAKSIPGKVAGGVWKYTLGSGSKNVPSLVTAPSRLINFAGNVTGQNKVVNKRDGSTTKTGGWGDAWTTTFDQRNFNIPTLTSRADDPKVKDAFLKKLYSGTVPMRDGKAVETFDQWYGKRRSKLDKMWKDSETGRVRTQDAFEFLADPLLAAPGAKASTALKWLPKSAAATASRGASKLSNNKVIKWLGAEHKTHSDRVNDFIMSELDYIHQARPQFRKQISNWQRNKNTIKLDTKAGISKRVLNDFKSFDDIDFKAFQKFIRSGDDPEVFTQFAVSPEKQSKMIELSKKWRSNLDELRSSELEKGIDTPFRQNYIPEYRRSFNLFSVRKPKTKSNSPNLWFTKRQKHQTIQTPGRFQKSLANREYSSVAARQEFPVLKSIIGGHEDIGRSIKRIDDAKNLVPKTKWEKTAGVFNAPMNVWKKSVLALRPAWYVNNEIFNQISGVAGGGLDFIKNQRGTGKYLKHISDNASARLKPSEAQKMVREIGSKVDNEFGGKGKFSLTGVASKQENRSRVALYRTFRQRGLSHDDAIKKVNDRFFDYSTKNWERPIKTVLPFWAWNKGLSKAAARMPFEQPRLAKSFNKLDQYQQGQFDSEFAKVESELKDLGYSDEEIAKIKEENAKYYQGRLKVGNKWITTPFNAFSEKGLGGVGVNPYLAALGESATATDSFGRTLAGKDASFTSRVLSKYPQVELGKKSWAALRVATGSSKPRQGWIGEPGSGGYGMSKERQGFDPSKPSYDRSLDPRAKLGQDVLAFLGVPRGLEFNKDQLVQQKRLQKVTEAYFSLDTKEMSFDKSEAARNAIFKKYGISPDEFYKGLLSKYDTFNTSQIKAQKAAAAEKNKSLFEEYAKQPKGRRNLWAVNKLRELNDRGYFDKNPFLKSFDWIDPDGVGRADKQKLVIKALETGDWSEYRKVYGLSQKQKDYQHSKSTGDWSYWRSKYGSSTKRFGTKPRSEKALARDYAVKTGDWSEYRKKYGTSYGTKFKSSPFKYKGKYFKSEDSMKRYKRGEFWKKYALASSGDRADLLKANPQYNERTDWTQEMWDAWSIEHKAKMKLKARSWGSFSTAERDFLTKNKLAADRFTRSRSWSTPKVAIRS